MNYVSFDVKVYGILVSDKKRSENLQVLKLQFSRFENIEKLTVVD